jgi:methionine-rich copper-binding protein CopC
MSVFVAGLALINPATATAHSYILGTSPARNAVVPVAPAQVAITWNEQVTQVQETVTGPGGAVWSTGSVHGSGGEYSVALKPSAPAGAYAVSWQVKSDDGDIVNGTWNFTVGH